MTLQTNDEKETAGGFLEMEFSPMRKRRIRRRRRIICLVISSILLIAVLVFIGVCVVPFAIFMNDINFQINMLFPGINERLPSSEINNFTALKVQGIRDFFFTVDERENVTLGAWHMLPESLISASVNNTLFDYDDALLNSNFSVLLHFHGNGGTRINSLPMKLILRKFFHVITFDYRGYGDSTPAAPNETLYVSDGVQLYKWLRNKTHSNIYVWGHSLGTAISTEVVAALKDENIVPMGLMLESPFNSLREEAGWFPLVKHFTWTPWFDVMVRDSLEKNKFIFKTDAHILKVDCPILILHAKDDDIIPYHLAEKLAAVARNERSADKGNVTLYLFPAECGYMHEQINKAPELLSYIPQFIVTCEAYENSTEDVII